MNEMFLIGRLTKDVELRYTQSGIACASFDLAVNNGKDSNGNERQTDFIRCELWEKQAENMAKYTHKGSQVAIKGSIKNRSWDGEDGQKKYMTFVLAKRVLFLDSSKREEPPLQEPDYILEKNNKVEEDPYAAFGKSIELNDDDLPF